MGLLVMLSSSQPLSWPQIRLLPSTIQFQGPILLPHFSVLVWLPWLLLLLTLRTQLFLPVLMSTSVPSPSSLMLILLLLVFTKPLLSKELMLALSHFQPQLLNSTITPTVNSSISLQKLTQLPLGSLVLLSLMPFSNSSKLLPLNGLTLELSWLSVE